jgi:hypothetical protein
MFWRRQAKAQSVDDTRTPEEIAEERIAEWKRAPHKAGILDLAGLGLNKSQKRCAKFVTLNFWI